MNKVDDKEELMFVFPIVNLERDQALEIKGELLITSKTKMRLLKEEEYEYQPQHMFVKKGSTSLTTFTLYRDCLEIKADSILVATEEAYSVICALRLLKPNLVGINSFFIPEVSKGKLYTLPGPMEANTESRRILKGAYVLKENEKTDFLDLCKNFGRTMVDKKMGLALRRFNLTYWTRFLETKLLDYVIALESLYLPGESEKGFRLCCYVTSLSSGLEEDTKEIWNYIDEAYSLRSKVVHGSGTLPARHVTIGKEEDKQEVYVEDFLEKIEEYTRRSIRKFAGIGRKVEKIQAGIKAEVIKRIGMSMRY